MKFSLARQHRYVKNEAAVCQYLLEQTKDASNLFTSFVSMTILLLNSSVPLNLTTLGNR